MLQLKIANYLEIDGGFDIVQLISNFVMLGIAICIHTFGGKSMEALMSPINLSGAAMF